MVSLKHVQTETPLPSLAWRRLADVERLARVKEALRTATGATGIIDVIAAKEDGQIILTLSGSVPAGTRGPLLLDFEAFLKKEIDQGLVVWLEQLGDRNSLRNLRGIEFKP